MSIKTSFIVLLALTLANVSNAKAESATQTTASVTPALEIVKPIVVITSFRQLSINSNQFVVKGTASDVGGIKSVSYRINNGAVKIATGTTAWKFITTLKKGKKINVTVYATDMSGNVSRKETLPVRRL